MPDYIVSHRDEFKNKFPASLRRWMIERNITKEDLADKTLISERSISSYMKGTQEPILSNALKIINAFDLDLNTFFGIRID